MMLPRYYHPSKHEFEHATKIEIVVLVLPRRACLDSSTTPPSKALHLTLIQQEMPSLSGKAVLRADNGLVVSELVLFYRHVRK